MERVLIIIFLFLLLPYAGLPNTYDIWITLILLALLVWSTFRVYKEYKKPTSQKAKNDKTIKKKAQIKNEKDVDSKEIQDDSEKVSQEIKDAVLKATKKSTGKK